MNNKDLKIKSHHFQLCIEYTSKLYDGGKCIFEERSFFKSIVLWTSNIKQAEEHIKRVQKITAKLFCNMVNDYLL